MQATGVPSDTTISVTVNGARQAITVDVRTTLLDCIRETRRTYRHQEGLRPRAMRRLHGACEWQARDLMP